MAQRRRGSVSRPRLFPAESSGSVECQRPIPARIEVFPDRIVIQADLTGYSAEEIDVRATERSVTISTHRALERCITENGLPPAAEAGCHRRIRLPRPVRPAAAAVHYVNGQLTIELPRSEPAVSLRTLPGGQTIGQAEIPLRTAAEVMPPSPGPHEGVFRP